MRVDGRARPKSYRLEGGEEVEVDVPPPPARVIEPEDVAFSVAYEDEHLIVVDKPAGVVVHPGAGHAEGTLVHGLAGRSAGGDDGAAGHRAPARPRARLACSSLRVPKRRTNAFASSSRLRALERSYIALVRGHPRSWRGRIDAPIGRDRDEPTRRSLDTDTPREAVTHFEVAELLGSHALLNVKLKTGRTHQIRVHLAATDTAMHRSPAEPKPADTAASAARLRSASGSTTMWFLAPPSAWTRLPAAVPFS